MGDGAGDDIELGHPREHGDGLGPQESGVTTLEQEVDNWDENAVDNWDAEDGVEESNGTAQRDSKASPSAVNADEEGRKRSD